MVLSPRSYNRRTGLCVVGPITNQAKGYPFEVSLPTGGAVRGVVLVDHVRSLSWVERRAEFRGEAPPDVLEDVRAKIAALIEID
jgi:mRNA interferase MazF